MAERTDQEQARDMAAYTGKEHLLADATRLLCETFSYTFRQARFKFQGPDAPSVEDFMNEAAAAFEARRGADAWTCLKAVILISNQEGENRHYGPRLKQLIRGRHAAPMVVQEKTLKGSRFTPVFRDAQMVTKFFSCGKRDCVGFHLGLRQTIENLQMLDGGPCPGNCGGALKRHNLTIGEQLSMTH